MYQPLRGTALAAFLSGVFGCHMAIRDQAQVDPVVASEVPSRGGAFLGLGGQPNPIIPNCKVNQWVERAAGIGRDPMTCPASGGAERTITLGPLPESVATDARTRRTQAQAELMTYADEICDDHVAKIYANHASLSFDLGFLTTLLSGGAAIASGRAATNLAAESALLSGTRGLVNSEVYYGYIGPAVMREIRSLRGDLRTQIATKRSCGLNEYPPQEAINDALIYHDACSFSTGLTSLLSKAGNTHVGEDKLRTAQLKATAAQLAEKKNGLKDAETERTAVDAKTDPAKAKMLDEKVALLKLEISGMESVLRFAGVVDPNGSFDTPQTGDAVNAAKKSLADAQRGVSGAKKRKDKADAQKSLDAAQGKLDEALSRSRQSNLLAQQIRQLNMTVDTLAQRKAALELENAKAPSVGDDKARAANETEIANLSKQIQQHQQDIANKETEKDDVDVTDTRPKDIEFGIQQCKPLKLSTAQ